MNVRRSLVTTVPLLAIGLLSTRLAAQVNPIVDTKGHMGIGTSTPDPSAILELNSTTAGLLLPRLTQTQVDNLVTPPTGLVVFNTTTGELNYNFGTPGTPNWQPLLTPVSPFLNTIVWKTAGNAAIAGDFLGTTNAQPLVIKTNNVERMQISAIGNVGIGTAPSGSDRLTVSGNSVVTGTSDLQGAVSNSTGDLVINDDANVTGSLDVDTDLNVDGNSVHVGTLNQQGAISNSTGDVVVNDDANVTGSLDVDTDLNVDGNSVHVGTLDQQGAVSNSTGDVTVADNLLLSNSGTASELRLQEPSGSGTDYTAFVAQAQANSITYTLPAAITATPGDVRLLRSTTTTGNTAATLDWVDPSAILSSAVAYNVAATQATATPRTNYLFDIAYDPVAPDAAATGARITASAGAAGNNNATALTLVATATGAGTATALDATGNIIVTGTSDLQGAISNSTGDVVINDDANVTGSLDVDTDLNVDGNATHVGTLDQQGAISNPTGDVAVNDDANVTGSLDVDTDLNVDGNATHVGTLDQQGAVSNSTGDVVINDDANVTGSLDVDTDLNVDGNSVHVGTLDQQGAVSNSTGDVTVADNLLLSNSGTASELRLQEPSGSGTDYTAFVAQAQAANITYTLPDAQGAANTVLTNDGSGTLTWTANGATIVNATNSSNTGGGAFAGNQDDLALSSTATFFRLETSVGGGIDITGIAGGTDGRQIILANVGSNDITLKNQDAGSTAANRFQLPGASDVTLGQDAIVTLVYDGTSGFWRFVSSN